MYVGILGNVKADKLAKDVLKITTTNIKDTPYRLQKRNKNISKENSKQYKNQNLTNYTIFNRL